VPLALVARKGYWARMGVSRTLNVAYLRPAPVGTEVLVECEIMQIGKRLCTVRGVLKRASDGVVLATCEHGKVNTDLEVGAKA
jgi:acyl-coenzyme A thioesterase 13